MYKHLAFKLIALTLALGLTAGSATAQTTSKDAEAQAAALAAKLKEMYPGRPFGAVAPTPIAGIFEVGTGDKLSYVDASGTYFLFDGQLVDFKQQVNLTEQRLGVLNKIDASSLPLTDAIKMVKGNGQRVLFVFSDPNCPYCKKLETDLKDVDNVTVYTFLYPVLQGSKEKAAHIWCSSDRLKTWQDVMLQGAQPVPGACDNPVERNYALGQRMRVSGTPTMYSMDGRRIVGAVGVTALNSFLDASKVAAR